MARTGGGEADLTGCVTDRMSAEQVMYGLVEEAPAYHHNLRTHQRLFDALLEHVRRRRSALRRKEAALGRQYLALYEQWRCHFTGARFSVCLCLSPCPCLIVIWRSDAQLSCLLPAALCGDRLARSLLVISMLTGLGGSGRLALLFPIEE